MKLCISSTGQNLNAVVDPRFGRATYYILIDSATNDFECVENPSAMAGGGAGTKAAQLVINKGVQAVLTGNVGPNAFAVLNAAGIQIYTGVSGSVQSAVDLFNSGKLQAIGSPSVEAHAGMGGGKGGRA
ncbi:MAG: NifB/NifX family molybdenum-iron cluster-binding protein [Deltaproteobacteria bacterium]|nr:NifB/NifX family molybdenum-iron cluster-binding protein [Deltaproteobacteria bacterium]